MKETVVKETGMDAIKNIEKKSSGEDSLNWIFTGKKKQKGLKYQKEPERIMQEKKVTRNGKSSDQKRRRRRPDFLPCPAEVQAAVELAVELCVVKVECEGEGESCLHLLLEVGQPLGHLHRVLVKHELHEVRVLQHKDLGTKNHGLF